ncbi:MAG: glycosyl-4,4'-diaponeurosporenoate acyltransferase [Clostridiaceae bacterium]|nr:glycosyl-4,4'-diaponeurosporenoate acyltransferase [Clostridiaceae bacterium]
MRILFLPETWTLVLCFIVWPILQVGAALLCLFLPDRVFSPDRFIYRTHSFEKQGRIYDSIFRVSRWKHLLPDGGTVWKKRGYAKRRLLNFSEENLRKYLVESCRAEMTHWLAIFPFWVFGLFTPPFVPWIMLAYAVVINGPCIIAQRYNRPRIQRLLGKMKKKHWAESED